jgi:uncharacterized OB-fold protein
LAQETATATEKQTKPIVSSLRVPENYPAEHAYFWGMKCGACGSKFLGARIACGKCGETEKLEEVRYGQDGELYVFAVVHQSMPGVEVPFVAGIIDLDDGIAVRANVYGLDPLQPSADWFGKRVKMYSEVVSQDREGNDVVAAKFKVA